MAICISTLEILFRSSALFFFLIGMLGFFVVVELYELFVFFGNEDLSLVLLANIFSHFVSFFFFFFQMVSFAVQKLESFIRSHLFIFVFI